MLYADGVFGLTSIRRRTRPRSKAVSPLEAMNAPLGALFVPPAR